MYDAILTERLGKPAVALCNKDFMHDARSAASSRGMPGIRLVPETIPCECTVAEDIESGVSAAMDNIVAALTAPLTAEEKSPSPQLAERPARVVFKGDLKEVNRFFYKRGWGDGLPIIPPTEEALREMLTGTDMAPDHVVGKIVPRLGKATIDKIAINAVMAGALPTHMPVLIAGVQALADPKSNFATWAVSTGSWIPFWIINGPIRNDLRVNSGSGALSPGDIANAAIGRAMGLIIKNIGGARKGIEDMGIYGNPGKYTMVVAENEEESPWEPLHVQHGFEKGDSTVTVSFPASFGWASAYGSDDKGILRGVISNLSASHRGVLIMLQPQHARSLARGNWTKKEIASFVYQYARVPAYRHDSYWENWKPWMTGESRRKPLNAEDPVAILHSPEWVRVLVAGGPGALPVGLATGGRSWITKKVLLPANWDNLVRKHEDIVPTYVRY